MEILDGTLANRSPAFRRGNVLISMRDINTIGVIDPTSEKLVWALSDISEAQHDPVILDTGHVLLFGNLGDGGKSRILELDPFSQEILWRCRGSEHGFFTPSCGSNQRLDNGNTLITETDYGRAFEVTPEGEIAWEFYTPHRAGENLEYIASLFDVIRLPADFPAEWATGS